MTLSYDNYSWGVVIASTMVMDTLEEVVAGTVARVDTVIEMVDKQIPLMVLDKQIPLMVLKQVVVADNL